MWGSRDVHDVEQSLVDDELSQSMISGVLTTFRDDPSRRVGDTEVEDLSSLDEVVERLHDLLDGRGVVLRRQYVNIRRQRGRKRRRRTQK